MTWGYHGQRIYKIQKRAIRTITFSKYYDNTALLFKKLELLTLKDIIALLKDGVSYASVMTEKPVTTGNNDELAPVWQTARNKRRKHAVKPAAKPAASKRAAKRPAATSRNSDVGERKLPIKAALRLANVFVSRLGPDETEATIKTYLETTLKLDVKVEL